MTSSAAKSERAEPRRTAATASSEWRSGRGRFLEVPGAYTPAIFRLDPMWDPLRKRVDFAKLVEAHD